MPALFRLLCVLAPVVVAGCDSGAEQKAAGRPGGPPAGMGGGIGGPPGAGMPVAVITKRVAPQSFTDRFTALGTARANESIEVTARTTSVITGIKFREGQRVRTGDTLVELDSRQESADLSLAEAQLKQAENQYQRSQALAATQAVSAADVDQLEANVMVARAQVRGAKARLDRLSIKAPFAGTVGLRKASLGDLVGPDTVITTLDDTSIIKLEFGIPENFVGDLRTGLTIVADSTVYPDRRFQGTVASIDSRVDPVTRAVMVIATVPNEGGLLKPGMFMTVGLEKKRDNVLLVPEEALVPREGRQYVFVVEDGKALEREVTLGGRAPGFAEIRSGLAAGALVVTEGTQRIRTGGAVQMSPES
ncbi:MAG: efflux RND transporter periplasmic adaptor subunit [Gammaproteobacteria bacterium]